MEHDVRPWGEYWVVADSADHKIQRISVLPGKRLSYQRHARRAEHWLVIEGQAVVTLEGDELALGEGDAIDIPRGAAHRIANSGKDCLVFVEVQMGDYVGEDDIERLEDDFGRAASEMSGTDAR